MNKLNLQARLAIILSGLAFVALLMAMVRSTVIAQDRIMEEVTSVTSLLDRMFSIMELESQSPFSPENEPDFLRELVALENIRHIDIRISSQDLDYPQVNEPTRQTIDAPGWFISLVFPDDMEPIRSFAQSNGDVVFIYPDPGDEMEEAWMESRNRIIASIIFLCITTSVMFLAIRHWMKELEQVTDVLENVEEGDFSRRIPRFSLPELDHVGERINHLTSRLGSSKSENERLTRKSVHV